MTVRLDCLGRQMGLTMIELILSMLIISVALVGILSVINLAVGHSGEPVALRQAVSIAESYLEEVLLKDYCDPDSPVACVNGVEASRALYDAVDDYNGLNDNGAHDQQGNAIANLANYQIEIQVSPVALLDGVAAKKVAVSVTGLAVSELTLVGYKAR